MLSFRVFGPSDGCHPIIRSSADSGLTPPPFLSPICVCCALPSATNLNALMPGRAPLPGTGKPPSLSSVSPADVNDDADEKLMEKVVSDDADTLRRASVNEEEPVTEKTTTRKKHIHKVGSVGSTMDDGDHENRFVSLSLSLSLAVCPQLT